MPADKLFMKPGQVWTLDQMTHALLLSSANDAAVALAEKAGGTVEGFQRMLALTAANLGMADSPVLNDPAGLDGAEGVEGGNLVSARDLAIATRALLNQPVLAGIVATPVYYFDGPDGVHHRLTNHNRFFLTTYAGAVGVKTGYTSRAGYCLIAAARREGRTMLAVILHGNNPNQTAKTLLDQGFATPVNAEPTTDRLPEVHLGPATPPTTSPPTTPASVAVPAHAALSPTRPARDSLFSRWWLWGAGVAIVVVGGSLVWRWRARRRRSRRRIFARR
jgi:D-alanyl-D-alanine carboxypeptidase (penicillin-binding protein 5/6)